jgi:hypothetical protein
MQEVDCEGRVAMKMVCKALPQAVLASDCSSNVYDRATR